MNAPDNQEDRDEYAKYINQERLNEVLTATLDSTEETLKAMGDRLPDMLVDQTSFFAQEKALYQDIAEKNAYEELKKMYAETFPSEEEIENFIGTSKARSQQEQALIDMVDETVDQVIKDEGLRILPNPTITYYDN
jgi:hypothetical protein